MSYYLYDASGYLADGPSVQGLEQLAAWAEAYASYYTVEPVVSAFFEDGVALDVAAFADALEAMKANGSVEASRLALLEAARLADEVLILSDGLTGEEPRAAGGAGSGNFGHAGRPGEVGGSSSLEEQAVAIEAMPKHVRDNTDFYSKGMARGYALYEARTMMPKQEGKLKKISDRNSFMLYQDADGVVNFQGEPLLAHAYDDPDDGKDEGLKVWAFTDPRRPYDTIETSTYDLAEALKEYASKVALRSGGGQGSGNFGHEGRPGEVGGSGPGSGLQLSADEVFRLEDAMDREAFASIGPAEWRPKSLAKASMGTRGIVKAKIVQDLTGRIRKDVIDEGREVPALGSDTQAIIDQWAATSGDSDRDSIAMQRVVAKEFELGDETMGHLVSDQAMSGMWTDSEPFTPTMREFVSAEYDATQEFLRANGIDHVTAYRGLAINVKSGEQDVMLAPASSWTTNLKTAIDFAESRSERSDMVVMATRVPASRVLSTAVTGRGCLVESEVILVGGPLRVKAVVADDWIDEETGDFSMTSFQRAVEGLAK